MASYEISHLCWRIANEDVEAVRTYIRNGGDCNAVSTLCGSLLGQAAERRSATILSILLEAGADPNLADSRGMTPLNQALSWPFVPSLNMHTQEADAVKILLEAGANPNCVDARRVSPLHRACKRGNLTVVKILLEAGAATDLIDEDGDTPLSIAAAMSERDDIVDILSRWPKVVPLRTLCLRAAKRKREVNVPSWVPPVLLEHLTLEEVLDPPKKQK